MLILRLKFQLCRRFANRLYQLSIMFLLSNTALLILKENKNGVTLVLMFAQLKALCLSSIMFFPYLNETMFMKGYFKLHLFPLKTPRLYTGFVRSVFNKLTE